MKRKSTKEQRTILRWLGWNIGESGKVLGWEYGIGPDGTYSNASDLIDSEMAYIRERTKQQSTDK